MRVAVIGARRRAQGIGAHLARFCVEAGAEVVAVLATTSQTAAAAAAELEAATGHRPLFFDEADALFGRTELDALVIASPHETHGTYLVRALEEGLHVLCEKPLCWGGADPARDAESLAERFLDAGLHLHVNAQWPFTLDTYRELHPGVLEEPIQSFAMRLSPARSGPRMLPDGLPHALSLLAAALPDPEAEVMDCCVEVAGRSADAMSVSFLYVASGRRVVCSVQLRQCAEQPRPAFYSFDGHTARRLVELDEYRLFLADGERRIPLPDPTPALVRSFLAAVSAGPPAAVDPAAVPGMRHLARIYAAYEASCGPAATIP